MSAQLLLHGIEKVYILARTPSKYEDSKEEWLRMRGITREDSSERSEFDQCDLSDIREVKAVADKLLSKLDRLDMLINNAGMCPLFSIGAQINQAELILQVSRRCRTIHCHLRE